MKIRQDMCLVVLVVAIIWLIIVTGVILFGGA